jgi:hypothetical protein
VVLARQAKTGSVMRQRAQAGITLATAIMYLRILAVVPAQLRSHPTHQRMV